MASAESNPQPRAKFVSESRPEATYKYRDAEGAVTGEKVRWPGKRFVWRGPDGALGLTDQQKSRVGLYRLPELLAADPELPVYVCEGEKDAERAAREGLVSTTGPHGAQGAVPDIAALTNRHVILVPDRDDAGTAMAQKWTQALAGSALSLEVRLPAIGNDLTDHFDAGLGVGELLVEIEHGPRSLRPSSLADLDAYLDEDFKPEQPHFGRIGDGTHMFYAGRVNGIFGPPESGKTWLALSVGAEALGRGRPFLYFDVDHNGPRQLLGWLAQLMGSRDAVHDAIRRGLLMVGCPDGHSDMAELVRYACRQSPGVAVVDCIGEVEAMSVSLSDLNSRWRELNRLYLEPLAGEGWCVIGIDHTGKSASQGMAVGASAKRGSVSGIYLEMRPVTPFRRKRGGVSRITVSKDRQGAVREYLDGGSLRFTMDDQGLTRLTVTTAVGWKTSDPCDQVLERLRASGGDGLKVRELISGSGLSDRAVRDALDTLRVAGLAARTGSGNSTRWVTASSADSDRQEQESA
jgi:hypothetical protein